MSFISTILMCPLIDKQFIIVLIQRISAVVESEQVCSNGEVRHQMYDDGNHDYPLCIRRLPACSLYSHRSIQRNCRPRALSGRSG